MILKRMRPSFHRAGELLAGLGIDDFDAADFVKAHKVGSR